MAASTERQFLDARRWYTVECFNSRYTALELARQYRRSNAFGPGRAFRVTGSNNDTKWCVQHAAGMDQRTREHGAYYNRRMIEEQSGQRKMGL